MDNEVFERYKERFGVELELPPLDFGHWHISQVEDCAQQALDKNQPITDWSEYFAPLPPDACS